MVSCWLLLSSVLLIVLSAPHFRPFAVFPIPPRALFCTPQILYVPPPLYTCMISICFHSFYTLGFFRRSSSLSFPSIFLPPSFFKSKTVFSFPLYLYPKGTYPPTARSVSRSHPTTLWASHGPCRFQSRMFH